MGYKKIKQNLGFADFALASSMKHNRSLKNMEKLSQSINWHRINTILLSHYTVGTCGEGADAYPPLLLYKCLLLQKWFHIDSDPELENQINDRLSFKKFLGLSFSKPSPDHSTFSRFRARLSKEAMDQINSEILRQFESQGLTINEGIAVDARLVKSASHPISNDKIKEARDKHNTPEGKLDKNGKPLKFHRDLDSTGWCKKIRLIMGSKNMPALIPSTALFWPLPLPRLRSTIPIILNIVRFSVGIPNKKLKRYMRTKVTPENPTASSWLSMKSLTAL